jgi:hypothetical protein
MQMAVEPFISNATSTHRPRGLPKPRIAIKPGNSVRRQTTGKILCSIMLLGCQPEYIASTYHIARICCFYIPLGI